MTTFSISTSGFQRWGGAALALGNTLFLANKFDEMSRLFLGRSMPDVISGENIALIVLGQLALVIGYLAFWRRYSRNIGRAGRVALGLFSGGGVLLAIGHAGFMRPLARAWPAAEYLFVFVLAGLFLLLIGLLWFGLLALRRPIVGRWRWLPLATGVMGFCGFVLFSGPNINATFLAFRTLFALGLIGLGVMLWLEQPQAAQ